MSQIIVVSDLNCHLFSESVLVIKIYHQSLHLVNILCFNTRYFINKTFLPETDVFQSLESPLFFPSYFCGTLFDGTLKLQQLNISIEALVSMMEFGLVIDYLINK